VGKVSRFAFGKDAREFNRSAKVIPLVKYLKVALRVLVGETDICSGEGGGIVLWKLMWCLSSLTISLLLGIRFDTLPGLRTWGSNALAPASLGQYRILAKRSKLWFNRFQTNTGEVEPTTKDAKRFIGDIKPTTHRKFSTGEKTGLLRLTLHGTRNEGGRYDIWRRY
jgi:hypothetical protein